MFSILQTIFFFFKPSLIPFAFWTRRHTATHVQLHKSNTDCVNVLWIYETPGRVELEQQMACTNIMNEWRSITIILKTPGWRSNLIAPSELIILAIAPLCIREQIGQCQGCRRPIKRKPKCERGPSFPSFVTPPIAKPQCLVNITATHVSRWEDNQFNKTFAAIIAFDSRGLLRFNKPPINGAHGEKYALPACGPAMRSGTGDGEKNKRRW